MHVVFLVFRLRQPDSDHWYRLPETSCSCTTETSTDASFKGAMLERCLSSRPHGQGGAEDEGEPKERGKPSVVWAYMQNKKARGPPWLGRKTCCWGRSSCGVTSTMRGARTRTWPYPRKQMRGVASPGLRQLHPAEANSCCHSAGSSGSDWRCNSCDRAVASIAAAWQRCGRGLTTVAGADTPRAAQSSTVSTAR